jgi:hypothetical protein
MVRYFSARKPSLFVDYGSNIQHGMVHGRLLCGFGEISTVASMVACPLDLT